MIICLSLTTGNHVSIGRCIQKITCHYYLTSSLSPCLQLKTRRTKSLFCVLSYRSSVVVHRMISIYIISTEMYLTCVQLTHDVRTQKRLNFEFLSVILQNSRNPSIQMINNMLHYTSGVRRILLRGMSDACTMLYEIFLKVLF